MPTAVNLRVARRPLDTLGVTFSMLRAGIRPLIVAVLKYAGLPALLGGAGVGAFYGGFFSTMAQVETGDFSGFGWVEGIGLLVGFLGLYAAYTVSMLLAAAWVRRLADHEPSDPDALWDEARPHLGAMLRLWLLVAVLGVAALAVLGGLFALLASASAGLLLAVMLLLFFPAVFVAAFLLSPVLMMVGQVMLAEHLNARDTLRRTWELLAGARGGSSVLVFVVSLIVSMLGYVVMIPVYGLFFGSMIWGGADDMLASMEKLGYAMGFVVSALNLIPQLLYFVAAGALYYARIEETEHVGFSREVGSLMAAFPDAPVRSPPPLAGSAYAEVPPLPNAAPPPLTDETFFAWTEPTDTPEPPGLGRTDIDTPDLGRSQTDPYAADPPVPPPFPPADAPDGFDRWRGSRPDLPPADAP